MAASNTLSQFHPFLQSMLEVASPLYANSDSYKMTSLSLEEEDCAMSEVEVDEVLRFMSDKRAEVATNNAVPSRALALIELKDC
jgi:hypothetical protein